MSSYGPDACWDYRFQLLSFTAAALPQSQNPNQDDPTVAWHTGQELEQFNVMAISVWWTDAELGDRLRRFCQTQRFAVFLDRRVDPSSSIDMSLVDVTKEQFLWNVAEEFKLNVCRIEDFYYLGPADSVSQLPAICDLLQETTNSLGQNSKVNWNAKQPVKTGPTVEPKQLLAQLAEENKFTISNLDSIPHDLWMGLDLPPTSLTVRVQILLNGFGKAFRRSPDGATIEIIDIPQLTTVEHSFRNITGAKKLIKKLRPQYDDVKFSTSGKRLVVKGPPINIAEIMREVVAAQQPNKVDNSKKTFTLTMRASRGQVLATVANLMQVKLVYDKTNRDLASSLNEQVKVNIVDGKLTEILNAAINNSNLNYEVKEGELRVDLKKVKNL